MIFEEQDKTFEEEMRRKAAEEKLARVEEELSYTKALMTPQTSAYLDSATAMDCSSDCEVR